MSSRKILIVVMIGLLSVTCLGPVIATCGDNCSTDGIEDCTPVDWLEWLWKMFIWLQSRPDGPPPVPSCLA
ncbi:MAG: hypothetical protein HXS47_03370 [Theionarchaea archaeon]|nr:hypothetical protein [Theionarchaea archaeon]